MIQPTLQVQQKPVPAGYQCLSQREHFNYLRNNSCGIWGTFTYGDNQDNLLANNYSGKHQAANSHQRQQNQPRNNNQSFENLSLEKKQKKVTFDNGNKRAQSAKKNVINEHNPRNNGNFKKKSTIVKDEEAQKLKNEENRRKVQNYIQELRPFSRTLTNSKYQQYYGKAAPECYGRANINEPIGGIIYGNHLKTFNMNPHTYKNNPEHYQTHTTALNFGKRTKICPQEKWKKLERELSKKLGLKEKNQTIKQGKQVVYVDVDDSNMYQVMKENNQFAKANREQIRAKQNEFKEQKKLQHLDQINQYYAKKQDKIYEGMMNQSTVAGNSEMDPEEYEARLNQQVIYKHHDKNGNIRYAGDRHAITCFVDLNFPENDAIYTQELKNRMPIYPIKVEGQDKDIDAIRIGNCKKGKQQIYPSHYLLRNCEEPEVIKMLGGKTVVKGKRLSQGSNPRVQSNTRGGVADKNTSFMTTNNTRNANNLNNSNAQMDNTMVKSQIMEEAWKNPNYVNTIQGEGMGQSNTCCEVEHLPHNQKNPQCYRNASGYTTRIPYAG